LPARRRVRYSPPDLRTASPSPNNQSRVA
jgi:hypothetical protein